MLWCSQAKAAEKLTIVLGLDAYAFSCSPDLESACVSLYLLVCLLCLGSVSEMV